MKALEKRMVALERRTGDCPFVVIYCEGDEAGEAAVARWELENGALGLRQPVLVHYVSALPAGHPPPVGVAVSIVPAWTTCIVAAGNPTVKFEQPISDEEAGLSSQDPE